MKKSLQVIGGAALLLWTLTGLMAWKSTSDQIHITIAEEESATQGPNPIALLTDQVGTLQEDLRGLTSALSENFELLGTALDAQTGGDGALLDSMRADLASLALNSAGEGQTRATAALDQRLARVEGLLQQVLAANEDAAERERLATRFAEQERIREAARRKEDARLAAARTEQELARQETQAATDAVQAEKPRRGFLSFQLPSDDFTFDQRQRFGVITSLSRVGFDAKSTLHDFTGVSEKAKGQIIVNLAHPEYGIEGELRVPAASLDTALEGRDEEMHRVLGVERFSEMTFVPTSFEATRIDPEAQEFEGTIHGDMTLHGKTRKVAMKMKGSIDASRRLVVDGEMALKMSDFGIKPPNKLGMIKVEDEVRVWISLRARPSALATGEN